MVHPSAIVTATTTITTIVSQNPCQTITTSTSYIHSINAPVSSTMTTTNAMVTATNFTTCNPLISTSMDQHNLNKKLKELPKNAQRTSDEFVVGRYWKPNLTDNTKCSMQSASYHRRHSVSGIFLNSALKQKLTLEFISFLVFRFAFCFPFVLFTVPVLRSVPFGFEHIFSTNRNKQMKN